MSFKKGTGKQLVQIGLFQTFLQYICFYIGMSYSSGIEGAIISGTSSFFQILLAHFLYKDDALNMRKIIGVSIGFCGVVLVNVPSDGSLSFHFGIGSLLLLSAAMLYSYGNILAKEGSKNIRCWLYDSIPNDFWFYRAIMYRGFASWSYAIYIQCTCNTYADLLIFLIRSRILHLEYNYEVQQGWKSINVYVLYTCIWCVIIEHDFRRSNSFICTIRFSMCSRGNYRRESDAS